MSDLISREKVIDVLKETSIIQDNDLGHLVVDEINRIPTAYDVEAVVEQLESRKACAQKLVAYESKHGSIEDNIRAEKEVKVLAEVIAIVRSGGKE